MSHGSGNFSVSIVSMKTHWVPAVAERMVRPLVSVENTKMSPRRIPPPRAALRETV
jgi:hypothetical protein